MTNFNEYKELLTAKASELRVDRSPLTSETPMHDMGDTAVANIEKEMAALYSTAIRDIRLLVEWALARIAAGEYGTCVYCEEKIPEKRLMAIPWAPLCIDCQEKAEEGRISGFDATLPVRFSKPGLSATQ